MWRGMYTEGKAGLESGITRVEMYSRYVRSRSAIYDLGVRRTNKETGRGQTNRRALSSVIWRRATREHTASSCLSLASRSAVRPGVDEAADINIWQPYRPGTYISGPGKLPLVERRCWATWQCRQSHGADAGKWVNARVTTVRCPTTGC